MFVLIYIYTALIHVTSNCLNDTTFQVICIGWSDYNGYRFLILGLRTIYQSICIHYIHVFQPIFHVVTVYTALCMYAIFPDALDYTYVCSF